MLGNATCAPDGTLFMEMADHPEKADFVLHSLTNGTEDVQYAGRLGAGYAGVSWPLRYFAGNNAVVALVSAARRENSVGQDQDAALKSVTLALIYDRKGTLEHVVPIPPKIDAKAIGMYSSGDLLVVAKDATTNRLHLLVLDQDGDVKNELSLFDYDYDANRKAGKKQPLAKVVDAANSIQIVPHGDNLLLVPQLTQATVIEVNEQGIVRATDLQLPHGYLLRSLFPGDGPYWTVSTYDDVKILHGDATPYVKGSPPKKPAAHAKASGKAYPVFYRGPLFQFNSFDGSLVRRIDVPKKQHANILCAHNGEFIAVTTDKTTGRLEELTGNIPR